MALEITVYRGNAPEIKVRGTNIVPVNAGDIILGRQIGKARPMLYEVPTKVEDGVEFIVIPLTSIRDAIKGGTPCRAA